MDYLPIFKEWKWKELLPYQLHFEFNKNNPNAPPILIVIKKKKTRNNQVWNS
jgi:hypothetical protein